MAMSTMQVTDDVASDDEGDGKSSSRQRRSTEIILRNYCEEKSLCVAVGAFQKEFSLPLWTCKVLSSRKDKLIEIGVHWLEIQNDSDPFIDRYALFNFERGGTVNLFVMEEIFGGAELRLPQNGCHEEELFLEMEEIQLRRT